jgi:hypothetical protein
LNLDDDQGDDNGAPPSKPSESRKPYESPKPTGDPDWLKRKCEPGWCGCCLDYYQWCKTQVESCKQNRDSEDCIKTCLSAMCFNNDSPETCRYAQPCGNQIDMCPEKGNARRALSQWQQMDARMAAMGGPAHNPAVPTPT